MTLLAGTDARVAALLDPTRPLLLDVGCGDGRHTVRWAQRRPDALVVGLDAETTRLDRARAAARRGKLAVFFVAAAAEQPPPALLGRAAEIAVVMPWGSLLDGILGADLHVLRSVLALGAPRATLDAVLNVRPWDAPESVDRKLAATPEPTRGHLARLAGAYRQLGWLLEPASPLTDAEARALGSTWASRVVSARASRLLRLRAVHRTGADPARGGATGAADRRPAGVDPAGGTGTGPAP